MLQKFNEQESRQNALRRQMMQKGHYARYTLDDVIGISHSDYRNKKYSAENGGNRQPGPSYG